MSNLEIVRTIILVVGWPVLIAGSIYLFVKGRQVYSMVKGSMIGKITKAMVITMLVEMYSLGIVTTLYMYENVKNGVLVGVPVFAIWFVMFVWSMKTLIAARNEIHKMNQPEQPQQ
jgi:hypothetical protein